MDDEDVAQAKVSINTKETPLYRIWPASDPVLDTTPDPTHGTQGWHVHAWKDEVDWKAGKKAVDQTFLEVVIDGRKVGKRGKLLKDNSPRLAVIRCPHCKHQHIDRDTPTFAFSKENHGMHLCTKADGGCGRQFYTKPNIGVAPDDPRLRRATCPECGGLPKEDAEQSCAVCEDKGFLIEGDGYWWIVEQQEREQASRIEGGA